MNSEKVTKDFSEFIFNEISKTGIYTEFVYDRGNGFFIDKKNNKYEIKSSIGYFINDKSQKNDNEGSFDYLTHYQKDAEEFDYFEERRGETAHDERRLREYILSLIPNNVQTILDAGCGRAWVAEYFCPKGVNVCSLDVAPKNVEKAKKLYDYPNHSGIVSDLLNLPFPDNFFDCIICSEVIEHIIEPQSLVNELFRCLKIGGFLILSTPYKEKISYTLCIHCNQKTPINAHLHSFDEIVLLNFFKKLKTEEMKYYLFGNKFLQYIRHHVLLKYFPFGFWKIFDKFFNLIYKKPTHIVLKIKKGG
ncbi:MAG: class I SAM-dependent methyltransferase [Candidatus Kapabacteria bacterium]|nr:class I SAM-dependent methyltransferase [Candidatus Kapabacteria bacterium]